MNMSLVFNPDVDVLVRKHTAFGSMEEMINAPGGYRPSMKVSIREIKQIADAYDNKQAIRGDGRRASRYR